MNYRHDGKLVAAVAALVLPQHAVDRLADRRVEPGERYHQLRMTVDQLLLYFACKLKRAQLSFVLGIDKYCVRIERNVLYV